MRPKSVAEKNFHFASSTPQQFHSSLAIFMEYEVYLGCNIAGALAVALIFIYHLIAAQNMKTLDVEEHNDQEVLIRGKKQQ